MRLLHVFALAGVSALAFDPVAADDPSPPKIIVQVPDAERGRTLFATKGCVICHSVNGVGGKAGPPLDRPGGEGTIDPLEFASRMWRGAAAMVTLQSLEMGYQIELTAQDIADLAAFVSSGEHRNKFSVQDVPEVTRGWTIDVPFDQLGLDVLDGDREERSDGSAVASADDLRGYMLTERWCSTCHIVGPERDGGTTGPAFEKIADKPDMSAEKIRAWLAVPHDKMPEFLNLTDADIADLSAYIMSLKR